jgi:predicted naringenin-chalcone synthase
MSFITAIGTAVPPFRIEQSAIANFMVKAMDTNADDSRKLRTIFKASGIHYRHSVLPDYGLTGDFSFYPENFHPFPTTEERLAIFRQHALSLSRQAITNALNNIADVNSITHLLVVSCTGLYAPGLDIELTHTLPLRNDVHRLCITFMGCYAAFNALKTADAFCKADKAARVLIVCIEMCSLHFQKDITDDNLLANALFADGAAAVVVENTPSAAWNFSLDQFHTALLFQPEEHMAWHIGNIGFEMKLSGYVPAIIESGIGKLTDELLAHLHLTRDDIRFFAIHPGGKKILEVIEKELRITPGENEAAREVLRQYGNMSSPTVLFVLKYLMDRLTPADDGSRVLSFAFGPGLTLESMLLTAHHV